MGAEASSMKQGNPSNPAVLSLGIKDIGGMVGPQRTESSLMGMAKQAIDAKKMADMGPQKMMGEMGPQKMAEPQKMTFSQIKDQAIMMGELGKKKAEMEVQKMAEPQKMVSPCPPGYKPHSGLCYHDSVDTNQLVQAVKPYGLGCSTGYNLTAGKCYAKSKAPSCPEGYQLNGGMCNAVSSKIVMADIKKPEPMVESRKLLECPPGYRTEPKECVKDPICKSSWDKCKIKGPFNTCIGGPDIKCSPTERIPR
jgi:hypothetical protein